MHTGEQGDGPCGILLNTGAGLANFSSICLHRGAVSGCKRDGESYDGHFLYTLSTFIQTHGGEGFDAPLGLRHWVC